ncbi:MAG: ketoacyl-ACP synthase III [Bdellovibrionales bacterium]|nr:ketoacyl-ACP synthase III [Bdellovibrionales bacterium]
MTVAGSRIAGTGSAFPKRVVTNAELCRELEGKPGESVEGFSPEWIRQVTGIETRHFSGSDETTSELATAAARRALEAASLDASALDGILVATCTPDTPMPAAAALVQAKLGARNAFAYDLNAACSGFHHAWATAHAFLASGQANHLLVVGADVLTKITDYTDRKSCILFGDGAGAMVLSRAENVPPSRFRLTADGEGAEMLRIPAGASGMAMKGHEIFKASVRTMVDLSEKILADAGLTTADIHHVVPHQANLRILERVAKQMKIPLDRFAMNITTRGNTSGATVPTALDEAVRSGKIKRGDRLLVPVFGAGLTAGAAIVTY